MNCPIYVVLHKDLETLVLFSNIKPGNNEAKITSLPTLMPKEAI